MKNLKALFFVCAIVLGFATATAQAPYRHSIGATLGSMEAFSWKMFPTDHFAFQLDAGTKFTIGAYSVKHVNAANIVSYSHYSPLIFTAEVNANFMYQGNFTKGLYGFIGGGPSLGYCYGWFGRTYDVNYTSDLGKFGVNLMLGLEYKFDIPLTLQFDFRPGYGMLFNDNDYSQEYFDWGLNVGVRYCLH